MGNFPSHTNHSFDFSPFSERSILADRSRAPVCQHGSVEEVAVAGGRAELLAHTSAVCIRMLDNMKRPKDFPLALPTSCRALSESFHLPRHPEDSPGEPYVSSALSQQQFHAFVPYHANEAESQENSRADQVPYAHTSQPGVQLLCSCTRRSEDLIRKDYKAPLLLLL